MLFALLAVVQVLGFSADDKSVAYIETGVGEGSGVVFARLHVIDVAKNTDKVTSFDGADAAAQALKVAGTAWVKPRTIEHDDHGELSDRTGVPIGTIELTTRKAGAAGSNCDEPYEPLLVKLMLHFMDDDKPARIVSEISTPKDRPCASTCSLDKVYAHRKAALVLVKCGTPGFEGKAETYTAYARPLPYGLDEDLPPQ
jgi:hypothetical protein